jgi:hypothetical protein
MGKVREDEEEREGEEAMNAKDMEKAKYWVLAIRGAEPLTLNPQDREILGDVLGQLIETANRFDTWKQRVLTSEDEREFITDFFREAEKDNP